MKTINKLWIGLLILICLSPLGIILPEYFKAGSAWGEWGSNEIANLVGYIPKGMLRLSSLWSAPLPDYAFNGWESKGLGHLSLGYIFSALLGIALTVLLVWLLAKVLVKKDK